VSGKALAAGVATNPEPVASAIPLTHFSNDAYLLRLMKRARTVAEQLGKRATAPPRPLGRVFKMFDDRANAVAEMSKFNGHGWIVFCPVSPVVCDVFMIV
jgi:hypothetical protein